MDYVKPHFKDYRPSIERKKELFKLMIDSLSLNVGRRDIPGMIVEMACKTEEDKKVFSLLEGRDPEGNNIRHLMGHSEYGENDYLFEERVLNGLKQFA